MQNIHPDPTLPIVADKSPFYTEKPHASSLPLVIHTKHLDLKRGDDIHHDDDVCVFLRCFPWCPPVNLNPRTVYDHMDADVMCCD